MEEGKWYVLSITISSSGGEERKLTPYTNKDTALRKFFEVFNVVGAGPKKIMAILFDENLVQLKVERWIKEEEGE